MDYPRGDTENLNSRTTEAVKAAQGPVHLREFGGEPGKAVVQLYFQSHPSGLQYPDLLVQKIAEEILKVRLRQRLRDENAGVYSVGANISSTNVPEGTLRTRISFSCDVQRYGFLTGQVYEVLDQLRNQPASFGRIMENIKLQLANAYVTESQRNTFWTSELRNHLYQEYTNWSYLTDFQRMLGAITPGDVMRFMDRHLGTALHIEAVLLPESTQLTRK